MIRCLRVTARHHTVQKMQYQLVVTSTKQTALIHLIHLDTGLMEAVMPRLHVPIYTSRLNLFLSVVRRTIHCHRSSGQSQTTKKMFRMQGIQICGPFSLLFISGTLNVQTTVHFMMTHVHVQHTSTLR